MILSVPLSGTWIDIAFALPPTVADGGAPIVITADAAAAMQSVLAIAAGVDGPDALPSLVGARPPSPPGGIPNVSQTIPGSPRRSARRWPLTLTTVPDALVGRCWPAVFAARSAGR